MDSYLRFVLALVFVLGLIFALAYLLRRAGGGMMGRSRRGGRRLSVVEATALDPKRRLVLVRRDGVEHLLLVGGATDVVIETITAGSSFPGSSFESDAGPGDAVGSGLTKAPAPSGPSAFARLLGERGAADTPDLPPGRSPS
ncbi:flagellar biosynthetic protein FliO [Rhodospirillum rubrum]|nr:flagellar biosynthetic protein FliO [Rhodospirillum rubrum]